MHIELDRWDDLIRVWSLQFAKGKHATWGRAFTKLQRQGDHMHIDLERWEVFTTTCEEFSREYRKFDIKFNDSYGIFGAPRFSYFIYRNEKIVKEHGCSPVFLSICNRRSLENMKDDIFDSMSKCMKEEYDIDLREVIDRNLVVVAVDSIPSSTISESSMSVFFAPIRHTNDPKERKDEKVKEVKEGGSHEEAGRTGTSK